MRLTRAKKGDEVALYFDDHVEDGDKPMRCKVRGELVSKGPKYVTVEAWSCLGDPEVNKDNSKTFTILTACIRGYAVLTGEWHGENPGGGD